MYSIIGDGDADYGDAYAIVFGEYGEHVYVSLNVCDYECYALIYHDPPSISP
jgi:hypothetical protein